MVANKFITLPATIQEYWGWTRSDFRQFNWASQHNWITFQNEDRIMVAEAPDFTPRTIAQMVAHNVVAQPYWHPNEQQLVFVDKPGLYQTLRLVTLDSDVPLITYGYIDSKISAQVTITHNVGLGKVLRILSWVDEQQLAFVTYSGSDEANQLHILSLDPTQLTTLAGLGHYWFSPDCKKYVTKRMFYDDLNWFNFPQATMPVPAAISTISYKERWFEEWNNDSQRLLYTEWEKGKWVLDESANPKLYMWDIYEAKATELLSGTFGATWSPVSNEIAFYWLAKPQTNKANNELYSDSTDSKNPPPYFGIFDLTTNRIVLVKSTEKTFTEREYEIGRWFQTRKPVWAPNGSYVIYWGEGDDLWIVNTKTTEVQPLTTGLAVIQIAWSSDSCYLAIGSIEQIHVLDFCD